MKRLKQWLVWGVGGACIAVMKNFYHHTDPIENHWSYAVNHLLAGGGVGLLIYLAEPLVRWRAWRQGKKLGPPWP